MPRWQRPAGPLDQVITPTGDTAFVGMDMKTRDPAQLLTGWYQEGYNARIENGGLATRKGCLAPGAFNYIQYGQIYGIGVYSDPNGQEYLAVAVNQGVWFTYDGGNGTLVPTPTTINYPVEFSQAFQNFYMWRGPTMPPLVWQGDFSIFWETLPDPGSYQTYNWTWNWTTGYTYTAHWTWQNTATPASGHISTNTNTWSNATTTVDIAKVTSDGTDLSAQLSIPKPGDTIRMQDQGHAANWVQWTISTAGTDQGTFFRFAVTWSDGSGTTANNNAALSVSFSEMAVGLISTDTNDWSASVTIVYVSKTTSNATDVSSELLSLFKVGDTIRMQNQHDSTQWVQWHVNAAGTDQGKYISFPVSWNNAGPIATAPANNAPLNVSFMTTSQADTSRKPMPNASTAETFGNRMLVPHDRDGLAISDIETSSYQWTKNDFRINAGEADVLVRIFPWVQETVLCFKQHSIFQMANVTGDLSATTLQKLPGSLGLCGLKAVVAVSGDIFFMDWSGVYKITQVFEGSPQASSLPVSDNIKPIIDSINWNNAQAIRAESRRERVYFAVPLLNAVRNNALLVYNLVTTAWESVDNFDDPNFRIDDLVKTNYIGERRLFAVDRTQAKILLLEQGRTDLMGPNSTFEKQIKFGVLTRGYAGVGPRNNFPRVGIAMATWNPDFTVEAYVDGSNCKDLVENRTKDRTKYDTFGKARWNSENLNDDHANARRKDYSVGLPLRIGYNGVQIERQQESTERFDVDMFGRYCQFRIANTQGTIGIRSVFLEEFEDQREPRTQL
jgi:hypothetical protein